ncbi:MAG: sensor histidine kinase [Bacillota bacterium]
MVEKTVDLRSLVDLDTIEKAFGELGPLAGCCLCLRDPHQHVLVKGKGEECLEVPVTAAPVSVEGVTLAYVSCCPREDHVGSSALRVRVAADFVTARATATWWRQYSGEVQARLIEELKINAELEEALRVMELRALQSQINPHFLFNTLTTIAAQAMLDGAMATQGLVHALARLLRYSLRRIGEMVSLEDELHHVQDYLTIQEARFGKRVSTRLDVPAEVLRTKIPLLTLQPLVENAIIHGFESRDRGLIVIDARLSEAEVYVTITDDGVGIPPARLSTIRSMSDAGSGQGHTTGLGVSNVHRRLQHQFGQEYGLDIQSAPGQGTRVTICIPFTTHDGEGDHEKSAAR